MAYRSKSPSRVIDELKTLRSSYEKNTICMTDNILDMSYFKTVLPTLACDPEGFSLVFETKANLRADQIDMLALAGVSVIQPGIESLSTEVLTLMKKGTTLLQNLQTLKWCKEAGIHVVWLIIYGFPGESEEEYRKIKELSPDLAHLQPPSGAGQIHMDRFSPYWRSPEQLGLKNVRQAEGYDFVYPSLPASERMRLAYQFKFTYADGEETRPYFLDMEAVTANWQRAGVEGTTLHFDLTENGIAIKDTRTSKEASPVPISHLERRLLDAFDSRATIEKACELVSKEFPTARHEEMLEAVEKFIAERWIVGENGVFISLVLEFSRRERIARERARLRGDTIEARRLDEVNAVA